MVRWTQQKVRHNLAKNPFCAVFDGTLHVRYEDVGRFIILLHKWRGEMELEAGGASDTAEVKAS